jgi:hypothetical protein
LSRPAARQRGEKGMKRKQRPRIEKRELQDNPKTVLDNEKMVERDQVERKEENGRVYGSISEDGQCLRLGDLD